MILEAAALAAPLVALVVGLIFGSFANVCIHRIPLDQSVVTPRSRCPACAAGIAWYDNVPILSWLLLRGRCRSCAAPIAWRYPLVEALMGAGFTIAYVRFGPGLSGVAAAWLFFSCVVLAFIDLDQFILPDLITLSGLAAAFVLAAARGAAAYLAGRAGGPAVFLGGFFDDPVLPLAAATGAAAGAAIPLVARTGYMLLRRRSASAGAVAAETAAGPTGEDSGKQEAPEISGTQDEAAGGRDVAQAVLAEGMGLGDVKMLAMVGAFLGAKLALVTILLGSLLGTIVAVPYLTFSRKGFKTPIPFGPFLALGAVVALFAGNELSRAYSDFVRRLFF